MELLVVEGVVRLREVDLPPRVRDLGALVGGLRGPGDVLREIEVAVGPHRGVDAPTDAGHPRAVLDLPPADEILRGEDDRRGPVAGGADVEPLDRPRHDLAVQHVVDRDLRIRKLRAWMPDRVALVLHRDAGDVLLLHAVDVHVAVHLHREDPHQVRPQRTVEDRVPDVGEDALRVRLAGGHLLLVHDEDRVREARSHVPPARDRTEDAGPAAGEDAGVRLPIAAAAVEEVFAFHVDAVERVRRGPVDDHVDVRPGQARGVEGHLGRLEAHLLARLLKAATEQGHPRADHPDLPHWPTPRTATAPVADGMYRQDCATPTRTPSI